MKKILPLLLAATINVSYADSIVTQWTNKELDAIREQPTIIPSIIARQLFIISNCMYDAWSIYDPFAKATRPGGPAKETANNETRKKAINFAAYTCAIDVFPNEKFIFDQFMSDLGYDINDADAAATNGRLAGQLVIDFRHHDGSNQLGDLNPGAYSDYTNYQPLNTPDNLLDPNHWQPLRLFDNSVQSFFTPHWYQVIPFALTAHDQFIAAQPNLYPATGYKNQADDLIKISAKLNDKTKMTYEYWAQELPATLSVPGHWNVLAAFFSRREQYGLEDDIKMFFALNAAMHDAAISAWSNKRHYDYVRPISAIRFLNNNKKIKVWAGPCQGTKSILGQNFLPYSPTKLPTPPFPEHISGHATMGAAAAQILKIYAGTTLFNFKVTLPPGASFVEGKDICPSKPVPATPVTLSWVTFDDAAMDNAYSRLNGGIHFQKSANEGLRIGKLIGNQAWAKALAYYKGTA